MANTEYENFTRKFRRVYIDDLDFLRKTDRLCNLTITGQRRKKPPKPVESTKPTGASITISDCGEFFVFAKDKMAPKVFRITKEQRLFVEAIINAENGYLTKLQAERLLGVTCANEEKFQNMIRKLRRKLQDNRVPVRLEYDQTKRVFWLEFM